MSEPNRSHLENLRRFEIESARKHFEGSRRVLEIGGGTGTQAAILKSWGYEVHSIDVPGRPLTGTQHYPVMTYDGLRFPFRNRSFDVVFSSNVLEHVQGLDEMMWEIIRVLTDGGVAVHVVPSATWRGWTMVSHYLFLARYAFSRLRGSAGLEAAPAIDSAVRRKSLGFVVRRAIFPGPHGNYSSAVAELFYFSRRRWTNYFERHGFQVREAYGNGLFYTGYSLAPDWPISRRKRLARLLGSSCHVFEVRPKSHRPSG